MPSAEQAAPLIPAGTYAVVLVLSFLSYLVPFGLIIHDVPEGYAMASAYVSSPSAGVVVALGIALHNLPEEFAISAAALAARSRTWLFGAAFLSSLAEPLGALLGLFAVDFALVLNAHVMAFAAGAMLFIALHELVPLARRYGRWEPIFLAACRIQESEQAANSKTG